MPTSASTKPPCQHLGRDRATSSVAQAAVLALAVLALPGQAVARDYSTRQATPPQSSGPAWTSATAPLPPGAVGDVADLGSVSCPAPQSCYAVGYYLSHRGPAPLVEHLDGSTWVPEAPPLPKGSTGYGGYLTKINCPIAGTCVAVGYTEGTYVTAFTDVLQAGTWAPTTLPPPRVPEKYVTPRQAGMYLGSLSCQGLWCEAVGTYALSGPQSSPSPSSWADPPTDAKSLPLLATWSVGRWHTTIAPWPGSARTAHGALNDVACWARGYCAAIGAYLQPGRGRQTGFIEMISPKGDSPVLPPAHQGLGAQQLTVLSSVACARSGGCAISGSLRYRTASSTWYQQGLVEDLAAGHWRAALLGSPSSTDAGQVTLGPAACPASGTCLAVGDRQELTKSFMTTAPVVASLSKGAWSLQPVPLPPSTSPGPVPPSGQLSSVSCTGPEHCLATGTYVAPTDVEVPLIEEGSPGHWVPREVPLPKGGVLGLGAKGYGSSACNGQLCVAVGGYTSPTSGQMPALVALGR